MNVTVEISHLETLLCQMPAFGKLTGAASEAYLAACAALHTAKKTPVMLRVRPRFVPATDHATSNKIPCIKALRAIFDLGLKDAKDGVEGHLWFTLPGDQLESARHAALAEGVELEVEEIR